MAPQPPVLKNEATCSRQGILVSWINASNQEIKNHTVVFKADSWWKSSDATVPGQMSEFLIQGVPPNSKVSVWIYSTDDSGSSAYSNQCDFVSSRDCGLEGPPEADIQEEINMDAEELFAVLHTEALDQYVSVNNLIPSVSGVEIISLEDKEDGVHKLARVTPNIPDRIRSMLEGYMGDTVLKYDEISVKKKDSLTIDFSIDNVPLVQQYIEQASGKFCLIPLEEGRCRFEVYFDLRVNYPVIGYYIAQVIRSSTLADLSRYPHHAIDFIREQKEPAQE